MAAIRKSLWQPRPAVEWGYFRALVYLVDQIEGMVHPGSDPGAVVKLLRQVFDAPWLRRYAEETARRMITHLLTDTGRTWREAARHSSQGRAIYVLLQREMHGPVGAAVAAMVEENARLIRTLPLDIAQTVTDYVAREQQKGRRAADIAADLRRIFPERSRASAQLIARTEVSKATTALTRARSEELGIGWYEWITSEDARVRDSHRLMDRVLVAWDDPPRPEALLPPAQRPKVIPGPYHAGNIYNCRCFPAPLIDATRLKWPHKVYTGGRIVTLTLSEFRRLAA